MNSQKKPDFLIVGAAKSGTTSLFHYLNGHKEVFIPEVKECKFFSDLSTDYKGLGAEKYSTPIVNSYDDYLKLFKGNDHLICGDASPDYLYYYNNTIPNIIKYVGRETKIIMVLRNPIDRAFSNYMHHIREGWENVTFDVALDIEDERINNNWSWGYHYFHAGLYADAVNEFIQNFKNIKVYLYDDLKSDQDAIIKDIAGFLEINPDFEFNSDREYNKSGMPKNETWHKLLVKESILKRLIKTVLPESLRSQLKKKLVGMNLEKVEIQDSVRRNLVSKYETEIKRLESIISRDLSEWLD